MNSTTLETNVLNPDFVQNQIDKAMLAEKMLNEEIEKTEERLDTLLKTRQKLNSKIKVVTRYNSILGML